MVVNIPAFLSRLKSQGIHKCTVKEVNYLYGETYVFLNTTVIILTVPASLIVVLMLSCNVFGSISNGLPVVTQRCRALLLCCCHGDEGCLGSNGISGCRWAWCSQVGHIPGSTFLSAKYCPPQGISLKFLEANAWECTW